MFQNNPLVLVGFYQSSKRKVLDISIGFSYQKSAGRRYNVFFWINPVEK
jgi:hypothetical protein